MVMLISLKSASLGINLTCANHVILMDLWWNPAVEEQAIDRAHRIGQTKDVTVTRIIVQDTVDERILELQDRKKAMVNQILRREEITDHPEEHLTLEDLQFLLNCSPARSN